MRSNKIILTMLGYFISTIFLLITTTTFAQDIDSLTIENTDTLQCDTKVDSCKYRRVSPTHTLGQVSVIDTLATPNSAISILLFNDNTWRYLLAENFRNDTTIYNDHWDTSVANPYTDVALESFAEATPIRLVDSLQSYHYPYIGRITSRYGPRRGRQHQGIDMALKVGDPVYATFDGKVRLSKAAGNYGNLVIIRHCNGLETYYAHLSERSVQTGDWVVAGQQIGLGGSTGRSTGPHLHYEVRYRGQSFDPERIIDFKTGELRRAELLLKRRHFSIYAKFDQNFDDEIEVEKQEEAERKAAAAIQYHTVRSGDTLGAIARKYGTSVNRLCQLNNIKSTSILRIGQRLRVR